MDRIATTKTFTCKGCHVRHPRARLAMSTSQCGLCLGCYEEGKRLTIEWISQFCYRSFVFNVDKPPWPPSRVSHPDGTTTEKWRGASDYVLRPSE